MDSAVRPGYARLCKVCSGLVWIIRFGGVKKGWVRLGMDFEVMHGRVRSDEVR